MIQVSVIIPTFGRPDNLARAIDSVLIQDGIIFEIIIVDDNEPNSPCRKMTEQLMLTYSDSRLNYVKHSENKNGAAARNTGAHLARGHYIAFLDDDDEYMFDNLKQHINFIMENQARFSYCRYESHINLRINRQSKYNSVGDLKFDTLCSIIDFNSSCIIVSKDLFIEINGFDESFKRNQDYEFIVRCMSRTKAICLDKILVIRNFDSKINHPNFDGYSFIREKFIRTFDSEINNMSSYKRILINAFYHLDLALYAFRSRLYMVSLNHSFYSFPVLFNVRKLLERFRFI